MTPLPPVVIPRSGARPVRVVLDNGATVILLEERSTPIVTLQAWFRTGSIHEGRHLGRGVSHYVEHMLFKGTPSRPVGRFAREIAAAGGHTNAYTHTERTVYHIHIRAESFAGGLEALADVVRNSSFDPAETAKEREVILRELEDGLEHPHRRLWHLFNRTAYRTHPFRHPIGGLPEAFAQLTRDDLVEYWRERYVPENLVFLAVGDFPAAEALERVRGAFGDWPRRPAPPVYVPPEPPQCGRRLGVESFRNRDTRLMMGWHTVPATHPDLYALDVLAYVLGIGRASRLTREVRDRRRLVHDIDVGSYATGEPGMFLVSGSLPPAHEDATLAAVLAEIARLKTDPVAEAELEQARNKVLANFYYDRQTVESLAGALGVAELTFGNLDFDEEYVAAIRAVRAEDLVRAAQTWFDDRNLTVAVVRPKQPGAAPGGTVEGVPAGTGANSPGDAAGSAVAAAADTTGPRAKQTPEPTGVCETLPGGARLVVLENHRLPIATLYVTLLGGVRLEDEARNGVSHVVAQQLTRGTATRSAEEIDSAVESIGAALEGISGRNTLALAGTALSGHLPRVLELAADCLWRPAFPETRLEQAKAELCSRIRARLERPWDANLLLFHRTLYGTHPYARPQHGTEASVGGLTRDDCRAFHARVLAPERMVIAVAGDVRREEIRERVQAALAGMAEPTGRPAAPSLPVSAPFVPPASAVECTQDIGNATMAAVLLGFPTVDLAHADRWPLEVLQQVLSSMGGRMFVRLRDELALAYSVGCMSAPLLDTGYFGFYVLTQPEKVRVALDEMRTQIEALRGEGVAEAELADARAALIGADLNDFQTNGARAHSMALDELYGLGHAHRFEFRHRIEAVTRDDLVRVAREYFRFERSVTAITGPGLG